MKIAKRYLVFGALVAIAFLLKFYILDLATSEVGDFRGGNLKAKIWNELVANDVNGNEFTVTIDNHQFDNRSTDIYMDENRNLMVPVDILRDAMNCSVHVYDGNTLLVEKHDYSVSLDMAEEVALSGDELIKLAQPLQYHDGKMYVSLNDLSKLLEYSGGFDLSNRRFDTVDSSDSVSIIPSRYDLREKNRAPKIRNQGGFGTCWASAALSAMESSLMPEVNTSFAIDHMTLCNSFDLDQQSGGSYTMGMAYLAAWQGPVYEEDDPYGDGRTDMTLTPVYHVQEMRLIEGKDFVAVKEAVFKYGGVQTSLYSSITSASATSENYNPKTKAYYYKGANKPNHEVVIIGWDDNFSKENFGEEEPEGDGAFICQNSWGTSFGDNGVFYVSYYDTNIGTHNVVYTRVEAADNYDHIYQSDLCGWAGKLGYDNKESIYAANVFAAVNDEKIRAAGFYAVGANTEYAVYVVNNFKNEDSFNAAKQVATGTLKDAGFYTIDFSVPMDVEAGEKYAILVFLKTPGATHPLAIEYNTDERAYANVDVEDGEGYISSNGKKYINVKEKEDCNICIKAYTDNR